jgi:hypothetical protein
MTMLLKDPCIITTRLLPGVRIGKSFVSIEYGDESSDGRQGYVVHIDGDGFEHTFDDLKSGCQGGDLRNGLASAMGFLGAAGESYGYTMRTGHASDNADMFPAHVNEWAYQNSDEISMAEIEIDETEDCIEE